MYDFKTLCIFLHFLKDNRKRLIQNQIVWHLSSMPIILKNIDSVWKGKKAGNGSEKDKNNGDCFTTASIIISN